MKQCLMATLLLASMIFTPPLMANRGKIVSQYSRFVTYTLRPGDNLFTIANNYFVRRDDYLVVGRINHVKNYYRLPAGKRLQIPVVLLRQERTASRVVSFSGPVRVRFEGRPREISLGMEISEQAEIETGANAFLTLRLVDSSAITIPSQSIVRVSRLRRTLLTGSVARQFDVKAGRINATVTPTADPYSTFRVTTPMAVSAVRGTEFRVKFDPASMQSILEVLKGTVAFIPEGAHNLSGTSVPMGMGISTASTDPIASSLLRPPSLTRAGDLQDQELLKFNVAYMANANGYRVQIAKDAGFLDIIQEATSASTELMLPAISDGTYFVRATAIDKNGIEGLPEVVAFERRLNVLGATLQMAVEGQHSTYNFKWYWEGEGIRSFRFQLVREDSDIPYVDEGHLSTPNLQVMDLTPGRYQWRVMSLQILNGRSYVKWTPMQQFSVEPRK